MYSALANTATSSVIDVHCVTCWEYTVYRRHLPKSWSHAHKNKITWGSCARPPFLYLPTKDFRVYSLKQPSTLHPLVSQHIVCFLLSPIIVPIQCQYDASVMPVQCQYSANTMLVQWQYNGNTVPIWWQYSANTSANTSAGTMPIHVPIQVPVQGQYHASTVPIQKPVQCQYNVSTVAIQWQYSASISANTKANRMLVQWQYSARISASTVAIQRVQDEMSCHHCSQRYACSALFCIGTPKKRLDTALHCHNDTGSCHPRIQGVNWVESSSLSQRCACMFSEFVCIFVYNL